MPTLKKTVFDCLFSFVKKKTTGYICSTKRLCGGKINENMANPRVIRACMKKKLGIGMSIEIRGMQ